MNLDVEFFGFAIYKGYGQFGNYEVYDTEESAEQHKHNYYGPIQVISRCYFVLDLGRNTKSPILFWSKKYANQDPVRKLIAICENPGLALMNQRSLNTQGKLSIAEKMVTTLKMKFGNEPIPIKYLTKDEWLNRYRNLRDTMQKIPNEI